MKARMQIDRENNHTTFTYYDKSPYRKMCSVAKKALKKPGVILVSVTWYSEGYPVRMEVVKKIVKKAKPQNITIEFKTPEAKGK